MSLLNRPAYTVEKDRLIYDATHPIDGGMIQVTITSETGGMVRRGQIIDCADGVYSIHAEGGEPSVIAAKDTPYASDDTEIAVPVYLSGTFRAGETEADPELTAADFEKLREKGIYLK